MFTDRETAGRQLAKRIAEEVANSDVVVTNTADGMPIARAVAEQLDLPVDLYATREILAPFNKELAIGAVTENGSYWIDDDLVDELEIDKVYVEDGIRVEQRHAQETAEQYPDTATDLDGKTVVITADAVGTATLARACIKQARDNGAQQIILATPVISQKAAATLQDDIDQLIALEEVDTFTTAGQFYKEFRPLSDDDAASYLQNVA